MTDHFERAVVELVNDHIIADALIDQSKQENPNCPCFGRVTAYWTELESRGYVRIADYSYTS